MTPPNANLTVTIRLIFYFNNSNIINGTNVLYQWFILKEENRFKNNQKLKMAIF